MVRISHDSHAKKELYIYFISFYMLVPISFKNCNSLKSEKELLFAAISELLIS